MMKRTLFVSFCLIFATSGTALAQSTKHTVKRKTTKIPTRPTPKVPASKLKKKPARDLNALRDVQCLNDIEYSTGYRPRRARAGSNAISCTAFSLKRGSSTRVAFNPKFVNYTAASGKIYINCKAGKGKCITTYPPAVGTRRGSAQIPINRKKSGQQSLLTCFKRLATMCK